MAYAAPAAHVGADGGFTVTAYMLDSAAQTVALHTFKLRHRMHGSLSGCYVSCLTLILFQTAQHSYCSGRVMRSLSSRTLRLIMTPAFARFCFAKLNASDERSGSSEQGASERSEAAPERKLPRSELWHRAQRTGRTILP